MNQAKIPLKAVGFVVSLLLMLGVMALIGCQSGESDTADEVAVVEPVVVEMVTAVSPTLEPTLIPTEEPAPVDNCLDCHTNKDLLIQTADPEEEVISENEGEG
ncbi:MAG: hypothetical protein H6657_01065 [Ardenticatenaceae bacterium]|nr:hypothetical protein [Ardenticatenaceae bacterium]